jgi:hypothetical protein
MTNKDKIRKAIASLRRSYANPDGVYIESLLASNHSARRDKVEPPRFIGKTSGTATYSVHDYTCTIEETEGSWEEDQGPRVKIKCDCAFFRWQGPETHASNGSYLVGTPKGSASSPSIKDPNKKNLTCKHLWVALEDYRTNDGY